MTDDAAQTTPAQTAGVTVASVASVVIRVFEVEQSANFYCDVFCCRAVIREPDAALLLTSNGFQIYLYSKGPARRPGVGATGVQYLTWTTDSQSELQRITQRLRAHDPTTYSHTEGELTFVEACDPDGERVIVVYPSPSTLPRELIAARFQW